MARIKLLRNKRDIQIKQLRKEIAQLLTSGQEPSACIRVCSSSLCLTYMRSTHIPHAHCTAIWTQSLTYHVWIDGIHGGPGGACLQGGKYFGSIWYARAFLWTHHCSSSYHWISKVCGAPSLLNSIFEMPSALFSSKILWCLKSENALCSCWVKLARTWSVESASRRMRNGWNIDLILLYAF